MILNWSVFRLFAVALVCSLVLAYTAKAQESRTIPWTEGGTYTWTAVDEDIRLMLRRVIQADGNLRPIIKPEVKGAVTVQFQNVPLAAAFNQLIQENNLDYLYNSQDRTVTVFAKSQAPPPRVTRRDFLSPEVVSFDTIRRALISFKLGMDGVTFDEATNTISIVGTEERISNIRRLVERLDGSARKRRADAEARAARSRAQALRAKQAATAALKAQAEQDKASAQQAQAEFRQKLFASVLDFKTKVIRLRFASVGSTQKKFQNRTYTVPGIEETLQKILGLPVTGAPGSTTVPGQTAIERLRALLPPPTGASGNIFPYPFLPTTQTLDLNNLPVAGLADIFRPVISTDPRTNSVIVRGTSDAIAEVEKIVRELDKPIEMVEIEVVIVKADSNVSEDLGIRYRGATQREDRSRGAAFDTGITGGAETAATSGLDAATLLPTPGGGLVASLILRAGDTFLQSELVALAEQNRVQVISSPKVVTLDNVTARVTQARNLFLQTQASGDSGQVLQQVETGLELTILPSIIPSAVPGETNLIRLQLTARKSDPRSETTRLDGTSADVDSAEVQTQVLVPDGGTFVMAGLFDDFRSETESGVPFLKDIPLFGALFRSNTSSDQLVETIFFLTPRIVDQARLSRDIAARVGTREYMKRKRSDLSRISRGIETDKTRIFPNALRTLEEDE